MRGFLWTSRRAAIALVVISALGFSFNGLIVRSIEAATPLQASFYRAVGMSGALFLSYTIIYRGAAGRFVTGVGWPGLAGSALMGASALTVVVAFFHATVANVVYVSCAIPFFTAALAWLVLREKVPARTLMFMAVAFAGITVMVGGGIAIGAGFGNLMALTSALCYALFVVIVRSRPATNMTPMVALAGVWICAGVLALSGGDLAVPPRDLVLCVLWGAVIAAGGHSLFVLAARNLAGAEVTFLMLLEFVLAPLWVWLLVNEVPEETTFVGGALVMGALGAWALTGKRA